jgi:O-antigen/teichoic acid export membrane protein
VSASSYGRGARVLSVGIATTGLVTFAFFAVASHVLDETEYGAISLLWSVLFIVTSVIYRPIEQLLSRSISEQRALGQAAHSLRAPLLIQAGFASAFLLAALVLRDQLLDLFEGSETLYWVLVGAVLAYAASYFARGWLAGNQRFGLYGGLVLFESLSRLLFPLAVAIGIAESQSVVAMGILAAPVVSLVVIPWALQGQSSREAAGPSLRAGGGFALAVFLVQLAEQAILNAPVLLASDAIVAGFIFNVLLIARAPLQLFQAIQTSLLPHLSAAQATESRDEFARAIRVTLLAIAGFAGAVALGLLVLGPWAMDVLFGSDVDYERGGLTLVALGMGFHLVSGTLNQAALARGHQREAAGAWLVAAVAFIAWMAIGVIDDELLRVEAGYLGTTVLLTTLLARAAAPPSPRPSQRGARPS